MGSENNKQFLTTAGAAGLGYHYPSARLAVSAHFGAGMDVLKIEQHLIDALEFAKQSRENLEELLKIEFDHDIRSALENSIKELELIRLRLRNVKSTYTAFAEQVEYTNEGVGADDLTLKIMAEKRAKALQEKIEAETRS